MAHHIDWDNIHMHIHDDDVRYKRRLCRKQLYITCSSTASTSLNTLANDFVTHAKSNHVDPDLEILNGQSLVSNVASDDDDFWVECSNAGAHSDFNMGKEDSCGIRGNLVDPHFQLFLHNFKVDGHSFALKLDNMDGSIQFLNYEKDDFCKENPRKVNADNVKNVLGNQKGDAAKHLRNNIKKRKRDKVVPRGDVNSVSTEEKSNAMVRRQGFSRNSNRFTVAKRSSVVKRGDDMEIISIGKPKEIKEVTGSKNYRHSKIIKNKRPLKMDDAHNIEYLRKSKKQYMELERRPCLTRTDHASNLINIAGREKTRLAVLSRKSVAYRTTSRNKCKDLLVRQGGDIESSRFSSGVGHMDVMVKEERFDDSTNVVLAKKRLQMIDGRDSVYDDNLQPRYNCDKRFGKYAEFKEENSNSLNYDKEDNEHSSDSEILRESKKQHGKLERRPCLTRADHVSDPIDIAGKAKRHLAVLSGKSANYRRTSPRNERRDLVAQQGEDIENSMLLSGIGNVAVMVKEETFDDSTDVVLVEKSMQMISARDSVYDSNSRPHYKCDEKFGKYAEVEEENAKSLNYYEVDNGDSSDLEILDTDNQQDLSKFEVTKVFNASVIEDNPLSMKISSDYETSVFREELMGILRRPFNLEEYRSLMQKAKYRHLNWGPEYSDGLKGKKVPNTYGKSPLDYHHDVQRRLRRCRKISKRLNILRGFIYWYGRTCQDGAFKPWLDKSCLAVTPSPR